MRTRLAPGSDTTVDPDAPAPTPPSTLTDPDTGIREHLLPLTFAILCAVLLAFTPPYVVTNSTVFAGVDAFSASALLIWVLDVSVVASVAVSRKSAWASMVLVVLPLASTLVLGTIPLGWWVALVFIAMSAAMKSWRQALLPAAASVAVVATFALTSIPFITPFGPQYALSPEVEVRTSPSGLRAGTTNTSLGVFASLQTLPVTEVEGPEGMDFTISEGIVVEVDPGEDLGTEPGDELGGVTIIETWTTVSPVVNPWTVRLSVLSAYLAVTTIAVGGAATVGAARQARAARRAARAAFEVARARFDAAHEESLAAAAATQHATAVETVVSERARVARDLHDVVAHHISLIAVRAESARFTISDLPDDGRKALVDIADDARSALGELRQILTVLQRAEGEVPDDTSASRTPQPGSADIPHLIGAVTDAGQTATLIGTVPELPPAEGLAIYRVVQESLTNARRHAPGAPVTVTIRTLDDEYEMRIANPLTSDPGPPGRGLMGMRERVESLDGTLTITTTDPPNAHFIVEARLPRTATADSAVSTCPDERPDSSASPASALGD